MLGRTHVAVGLLLGLIAVRSLSFPLFSLPCFLLGSIFADIDTPTSIVGRKVKLIGWVFTHRGFFHSVLALSLFTLLVYAVGGVWYGVAFGGGYLSHLLLDALTKQGLVLYPLRYTVRGPLRSGGVVDMLLFISSLAASGILVRAILLTT